jgi:hypothetical protein
LAEDGTVYYAVNDGDGSYVLTVEDDDQQYQYVNEEPMEQDNQDWEESNAMAEEQQEQVRSFKGCQSQGELRNVPTSRTLILSQAEQDQIFLHEDSDGQLYFKNEHGQLQPVYMTADGNYAIAENSSDEQDSQGDINQMQEEQAEDDNYILPELDVKQFNSKKVRAL